MKKTSTFLLLLASAFSVTNAQNVPMMPLHEVFSSSTCYPCVAGNQNLNSIFTDPANLNKFTCIKYQCWFPGNGDPYSVGTSEPQTRLGYYDTDGSYGIPDMYVNGPHDYFPPNYTQSDFDDRSADISTMTIKATYEISGNNITVKVDMTSNVDIALTTGKLRVAVVERKTTGNVGTNGETEWHFVNMKMLPSTTGTAVGPFVAGTTISKTLPTYDMSSTHVEDMWELSVVCFVQAADKSVLQSAWAEKTLGVEAAGKEAGIYALYPNPSSQQTTLQYGLKSDNNVTVDVINNIGQVVYTRNEGTQTVGNYKMDIDTKSFATGIYSVRLTVGNDVMTRKLSVVQ